MPLGLIGQPPEVSGVKVDTTSVDFFIQAAIAVIIITTPPDPAKILIFNQ